MSRVGKAEIVIPQGVDVTISGATITVKGSKGSLVRVLPLGISVKKVEATLVVERASEDRAVRSSHGMIRAMINNMVNGVTQGFAKELEIIGVGYRAVAKGQDKLELALGFSHPVPYAAPQGVTFEVPQPTRIIVKGIDKELVGQVAAEIRSFRSPEPYKGKGVRYLNERVLRKAGKTGKK
ncbi:MAG: 50S ribosomal protein L6 [Actinomycetota bacterium]|jgi:large subunit ribosomal protein L6|nr:MAG: 50S ribosomal protein L6 [Acidimicrobium sp. BACL19 MAG-120924-bin39]MDA2955757.1 50S ribosomal protein L6 [Actinomycetota bacterium]MDP4642121.1 50S ribosomal protein L6 [Ilumatobacteraceae bacterium]MDP4834659.1 50S ribosomal protein L6 [Ilumatobacteraceae bacterium]